MLDLSFTDEQQMLREVVRSLCASHAPLGVVREMEDDPIGYPAELWKQLADLDLTGLLLPEEHGGAGMSLVEGIVLYEELGRALAPSPHFVSCVLSGGLLARAGTDDQRSTWLPRIVSGEAVVTPAWLEPDRGFGRRGVQARATRDADGEGWLLSGTKRHVSFARSATRLLVLAQIAEADGDANGAGGDLGLFLVSPDADGVTLTQQHTIASDTQYRVDLDGARVADADLVGGQGDGWPAWEAVRDDALILLAAWAVGAAEHAQATTVQYAKDRQQFGKPIGAFQSIAHYLSDRQTELDGARTLTHHAAWARTTGRPAGRHAAMAKLYAGSMLRDLTATAQQIFGGVGFTVEYDIQLYFRRAKALQLAWWDDRYLEELIATDILD